MDIKRPAKSKLKKRVHVMTLVSLSVLVLGGITFSLTKLKPAAPQLDRSTVVIDTVRRGQMLRQVRGTGTLAAQEVRWIPAPADGRVERILLQPGVKVVPDSLVVVLSNPQIEQQAMDTDFQLKVALADEDNLRVRLESENIAQQGSVASITADYRQAKLQLDTDEVLGKQGLVAELSLKLSRVHVEDLANRLRVEQQRLAISAKSVQAQINAQHSRVEQLQTLARLKHDQVANLKVRVGMAGVLQQVSAQVGQQVTQGFNIARVANPSSLKAELKIAETQIKDIKLGQTVEVDTRNGIIPARVSRIDPAAHEGTFIVDAELTGQLPPSARPDLTVDGTIELERLENVLYIGRPAFGQAQSTVTMFRLTSDVQEALRTLIVFGRSSVNSIEIISGLREGDQVVLSDTSAWDSYNRIRLK